MAKEPTPKPMTFRVHVALDQRGEIFAVATSAKTLHADLKARNAGESVTVLRLRVDGHPFALGMLRTQLDQKLGLAVPMSAVRVL